MCMKYSQRVKEKWLRVERWIAEVVLQQEMIGVYIVYLHVKGGLQILLRLLYKCLFLCMSASCDKLAVWVSNLY